MLIRFVLYGLLGWCVALVWSAVGERLRGKQRDWRLLGHASRWLFPRFGLLAPLYEPVHEIFRPWHWFMRGTFYGMGFWAVEFAAGWLLRRVTGACPWDRSHLRGNLQGILAWEYGPVWFAFGLALEPVHDFFLRLTPALQAALGL